MACWPNHSVTPMSEHRQHAWQHHQNNLEDLSSLPSSQGVQRIHQQHHRAKTYRRLACHSRAVHAPELYTDRESASAALGRPKTAATLPPLASLAAPVCWVT